MPKPLTPNMTPTTVGPELYSFEGHKITVREGSGFNSDNPQHAITDSVRWGIAIQEARTAGNYELADTQTKWVIDMGYDVGTGPGYTVIANGNNMVEANGIIYDRAGPDPENGIYLLYEA